MSPITLFASTRDASLAVGFSVALMQGLAPDGGLFLPATLPRVVPKEFDGAESLAAIATRLLTPFVGADPLTQALPELAAEAFRWPAPLQPLDDEGRLFVLELFHGPTAAFKDFGAQFLAACFARLRTADARALTILVAMEKLAPKGDILAKALGALMIGAGAVRLIWQPS